MEEEESKEYAILHRDTSTRLAARFLAAGEEDSVTVEASFLLDSFVVLVSCNSQEQNRWRLHRLSNRLAISFP